MKGMTAWVCAMTEYWEPDVMRLTFATEMLAREQGEIWKASDYFYADVNTIDVYSIEVRLETVA